MSGLPLVPDSLAHDWQGLTALIEETARRQTVPCINGDQLPREFWTSDSLASRNQAAKACGPCPVLTQCRQYGVQHPREVGVYGGLIESWREHAAEIKDAS